MRPAPGRELQLVEIILCIRREHEDIFAELGGGVLENAKVVQEILDSQLNFFGPTSVLVWL